MFLHITAITPVGTFTGTANATEAGVTENDLKQLRDQLQAQIYNLNTLTLYMTENRELTLPGHLIQNSALEFHIV